MSKKYTKDEMTAVLNGLSSRLSEHTGQFPGVSGAVLALALAAKDPMAAPEGVKVKKEKKAPKVKPVALDYSGDSLMVKGIPWGQVGVALKAVFNELVGKQSKMLNPDTGKPFFRTCYDKKAKAFRLPKDKEPEVRAAIEAAGLAIVSAG
jgi:hypothetical protein